MSKKPAAGNRFEGLEDVVDDPTFIIKVQEKEDKAAAKWEARARAVASKKDLRDVAFVKPSGKKGGGGGVTEIFIAPTVVPEPAPVPVPTPPAPAPAPPRAGPPPGILAAAALSPGPSPRGAVRPPPVAAKSAPVPVVSRPPASTAPPASQQSLAEENAALRSLVADLSRRLHLLDTSDIPALHAELERERAINKEYALEIARLHMEVTKLSQAAPAAVTSIAPSIIQSAPASTPSPFTPSSTAYKPPTSPKKYTHKSSPKAGLESSDWRSGPAGGVAGEKNEKS